MGLRGVSIRTTQPPGGRAWPGDVRKMQLDIAKIKRLGWKPERNSEEAIRLAAEQLINELVAASARTSSDLVEEGHREEDELRGSTWSQAYWSSSSKQTR